MYIVRELFVRDGDLITVVKNYREALKIKKGKLYIRTCLSPIDGCFCFNDTAKETLVGNLSSPLNWLHYHAAYDRVAQ